MRPLRLLLTLATSLVAVVLVLYTVLSVPPSDEVHTSTPDKQQGYRALLSFTSPGSLFPPSAIISLTDDNSTFFLARPAAFGPALPKSGLSSALWVGSGFSDDSLAKGELGCSDADHGSLQDIAEIQGKVVLLKRGECGFAEKVLWAQRRGAVAVIVGDNVRGGGLIRMYAQGDTSNITISSLFTSHTTAHLLSSLLPRGVTTANHDVQEYQGQSLPESVTATAQPVGKVSPTGFARPFSNDPSIDRKAWWTRWLGLWSNKTTNSRAAEHIHRRAITSITDSNLDSVATSSDDASAHEGLWVTLTPTNVSTSPFFDTLLVLVVSPLVTLTVVYALLLLRSRIRRRRWRAPKSLVERLPVRTYQTISESTSSATPSASSPTTPLLQHHPQQNTASAPSPCSSNEGSPATSSATLPVAQAREEEKRETGLAEWRRRYGGRQRECVVCLDEYEDGVSQVMSLPCGHEFHADCITPWLVTRRRTCPICKGDVVRSLAQSHHNRLPSPSLTHSTSHRGRLDDVQAQAAGNRNDSPSASLPMPISASLPIAGSRNPASDVEANWSGSERSSPSGEGDGDRSNLVSTSLRDLSSTVSTVIWRGLEAVRNTTGLQRRPPEDVDRDR